MTVVLLGGPWDGTVVPEPPPDDDAVNVRSITAEGYDTAHYQPIDGEWRWTDTTQDPRTCAWCRTATPKCELWAVDDRAWWCWEPCYEEACAAAGKTPITCPDCERGVAGHLHAG